MSSNAYEARRSSVEEIINYLTSAQLDYVYGECLSGNSVRRRYVPQWPQSPGGRPDRSPCCPRSQEEADKNFQELIAPFRQWWIKLRESGSQRTTKKLEREQWDFLMEQKRQRTTNTTEIQISSGNMPLYRNVPDAALEARVWATINLVHILIKTGDLERADETSQDAVKLASRLAFRPIVGKCHYWRGIVAHNQNERWAAATHFLEAFHAYGFYEEGELLADPVKEYKDEMFELLDTQEALGTATSEEAAWAQQCRRAILGIDPWFQREGQVLLASSDGSNLSRSPSAHGAVDFSQPDFNSGSDVSPVGNPSALSDLISPLEADTLEDLMASMESDGAGIGSPVSPISREARIPSTY